MFLLGVLSSAYPERQELFEVPRQHMRGASKQETTGYYNKGISMVVPAEKVVEILNSPEAENMRKKDEPKPVKPAPLAIKPGKADKFTQSDFETALKKVSRKLPREHK